MKSKLLLSSLLVLTPAFAASEKSADTTPGSKSAESSKRHPLRGVIMSVYPEKSAIMVKHEDVPGVMGGMTMMFKVDAATLKTAKPGQAITGMLSRDDDVWWLHEVKIVGGKKN